MKALGIAATGMLAQQTNVDVIANNIANANTTGFKSGRAAFQDLMYQSVEREGALTAGDGTSRPVGLDVGLVNAGLVEPQELVVTARPLMQSVVLGVAVVRPAVRGEGVDL